MVDLEEFYYTDTVRMQFAFGPDPQLPPAEVWITETDSGYDWNDDEFFADFRRVHRGPEHGPYEYTMEINKSRQSWGADGGVIQVLVYMQEQAVNGVIGATAVEGLKALLTRMVRKEGEPRRLSRAEAVDAARWRILMAYPTTSSEALRLVAEEHPSLRDRGHAVEPRVPSVARLEARLSHEAELAVLSRRSTREGLHRALRQLRKPEV